MSSSEPKKPDTTDRERWLFAGRNDDFDAAVIARDTSKAIEVLFHRFQASFTYQFSLLVDKVFANPADYGYPPSLAASEDGDEDEDAEEDDPTRVHFTLTVISEHPIDELERFLQPPRPRRPRRPDDAFMYPVHRFYVEDDDWRSRGDAVDAGVLEAIDVLDATGVALERLTPPNAWVRAHFTFTPGAETITAAAVKRLAAYNAVLWIDVDGG